MKKVYLFVLSVLTGFTAFSQSTLPTDGSNVGVGTLSPASLFSVGSSSQFQVTSSGLLLLKNSAPEMRFHTTGDDSFARFLRSSTSSNNLFQGRNQVLQASGTGGALFFPGTLSSQSVTLPDNGLSTSSGFVVSFWFKAPSIINQGLLGFSQPASSSTSFLDIYTNENGNLMAVLFNNPNGTFGIQGPVLNPNTNYHVVYYYQPGNVRLFLNGTEYTTPYGAGGNYWAQVSGQTFYLGVAPYTGRKAANVTMDQVLFYSALDPAASSGGLPQIYNGGNGTGNIPTAGLIRRYDFEDVGGDKAVDGMLTGYDATLNNGVQFTANGIISLPTTPVESTFFSVSDGAINQERGIATWGDLNGRNQQAGKWFQWKQGNNYPLVSDNNGHWLFNPNNTSATLPTVASTVDVAGNLTVGSAYVGTNAAPKDGLIVQGNTGIGTAAPLFPLQVNQPLNGQGTISVTAGSGAITGTGTRFSQDFNVGDVINANGETHTITAIASFTSMTTDNWTGTYTGNYTTSNTIRVVVQGRGMLNIGNSFFAGTTSLNISKGWTNGPSQIFGARMISSYNYTAPPTGGTIANTGFTTVNSISPTNTQNWGSLKGFTSTTTVSGSAGSIQDVQGSFNAITHNGAMATTNSSAYLGTINNSGSGGITNAYILNGNIANSVGTITNYGGVALSGIGAATNNTGVYLTTTGTNAIPTGNWGIYDNTGYNNYFAGNVVIGRTAMPTGYRFAVAGNAIAESMTVLLQANWPDYVFKPTYGLTPLSELKTYIDKNQHLPEIPSTAEVEKDGQNLGEMNKLLLKKVEELTLYLIDKEKQVNDLKTEAKTQNERLNALEKQVEKLTKAVNNNGN